MGSTRSATKLRSSDTLTMRVMAFVVLFLLALQATWVSMPSAQAQPNIDSQTSADSEAARLFGQIRDKGITSEDLGKMLKINDPTENKIINKIGGDGDIRQRLEDVLGKNKEGSEFKNELENALKESDREEAGKAPTRDMSFNLMQSAISGFYQAQLSAMEGDGSKESGGGSDTSKDNKLGMWKGIGARFGGAGAFVGYCDSTVMDGCTKWLGGNTQATTDYSYAGLRSRLQHAYGPNEVQYDENDPAKSIAKGVYDYATFGAALNMLGFDETLRGTGRGNVDQMMGYTTMAFFVMASGADAVFDIVLKSLKLFNPFAIFVPKDKTLTYDGVTFEHTDAVGDKHSTDLSGDKVHADNNFKNMPGDPIIPGTNIGVFNGLFSDVTNFLQNLYVNMVSIGWFIVIPFTMAFALLSILIFRRTDKMEKAKKLAIRMVYLAVGMPIIGMLYTGSLDIASRMSVASSANPTRLVLSNYVDFGSWVQNTHMYIPPSEGMGGDGAYIAMNAHTSNPAVKAQLQARNTALAINYVSVPNLGGYRIDTKGVSNAMSSLNGMNHSTMTGLYDTLQIAQKMDNATAKGLEFITTFNILNSYVNNEQISASAYEQAVKSYIEKQMETPEGRKKWEGVFDPFTSVDALMRANFDEIHKNRLVDMRITNTVIKPYTVQAKNPKNPSPTDMGGSIQRYISVENTSSICSINKLEDNCPMSPISMYNYLSTDFTSTSATYWSPERTASPTTKVQHATVSMVGNGIAKYVYWASTIATLASVVVISYAYAIFMMFGAIKRLFQMIVAIPVAAMGVIPAIAKVLVYVIALITELLATVALYYILIEIVAGIPQMFEGLVSKAFAGAVLTSAQQGAGAGINDYFESLSGQGGLQSLFGKVGERIFGRGVEADINPATIPVYLLVVAVMTALILVFTIMAVIFRSKMVRALDEGVTNMINKFLDTSVSAGNDPSPLRNALLSGGAMAGAAYAMNGAGGAFDSDGDGKSDMAGLTNSASRAAASFGAGMGMAGAVAGGLGGASAIGSAGGIVGGAGALLDGEGARGIDVESGIGADQLSGDVADGSAMQSGALAAGLAGSNVALLGDGDATGAGMSGSDGAAELEANRLAAAGGLSDSSVGDALVANGATDLGDGTYRMPDGSVVDSNGLPVSSAVDNAGEPGEGIYDANTDAVMQAHGDAAQQGLGDDAPGDTSQTKDLPQVQRADLASAVPVGDTDGIGTGATDEVVGPKQLGGFSTDTAGAAGAAGAEGIVASSADADMAYTSFANEKLASDALAAGGSVDSNGNVLDSNGNVVTDAAGEAVQAPAGFSETAPFGVNEDGVAKSALTNLAGQVVDNQGKPVFDATGAPVMAESLGSASDGVSGAASHGAAAGAGAIAGAVAARGGHGAATAAEASQGIHTTGGQSVGGVGQHGAQAHGEQQGAQRTPGATGAANNLASATGAASDHGVGSQAGNKPATTAVSDTSTPGRGIGELGAQKQQFAQASQQSQQAAPQERSASEVRQDRLRKAATVAGGIAGVAGMAASGANIGRGITGMAQEWDKLQQSFDNKGGAGGAGAAPVPSVGNGGPSGGSGSGGAAAAGGAGGGGKAEDPMMRMAKMQAVNQVASAFGQRRRSDMNEFMSGSGKKNRGKQQPQQGNQPSAGASMMQGASRVAMMGAMGSGGGGQASPKMADVSDTKSTTAFERNPGDAPAEKVDKSDGVQKGGGDKK